MPPADRTKAEDAARKAKKRRESDAAVFQAQKKKRERQREIRANIRRQEEDPDAFCIGRKGCYTSLVGCAAFICMSVFAFFIIVILFYLEDFGDIDLWIYGDTKAEAASPPPPVPLVGP